MKSIALGIALGIPLWALIISVSVWAVRCTEYTKQANYAAFRRSLCQHISSVVRNVDDEPVASPDSRYR